MADEFDQFFSDDGGDEFDQFFAQKPRAPLSRGGEDEVADLIGVPRRKRSNAGDLSDMLLRGVMGIPEMAGNALELPVNIADAAVRALGGKPGPVLGTVRRGVEYVADAARNPAAEMDAIGMGRGSVSGGQLVDAFNPNADSGGLLERANDVGRFALETGVRAGPEMLAAVGALPAYIAGRTNAIAENRAKNDGRTDPSLADIGIAAPAATFEALLERFTTARLLPQGVTLATPGVKAAITRIAKETGIQAPLGGLEELAPYLAETAGTDKGSTGQGALESLVGGIVGEGALGAAASGAKELAVATVSPERRRNAMLADILAESLGTGDVDAVAATMRPDAAPTTDILVDALREAQAPAQAAPDPIIEALQAAVADTEVASDGSAPDQSVVETIGSLVDALDGADIRPDAPADLAVETPSLAAEVGGREDTGADDAVGTQAEGVTREQIAEDNARAAMELNLDAEGRPAPEPEFPTIEEDGFKRKFTTRQVPNKKGGMTTINDPVLDYGHDNLLHFLAAAGGVNVEAIAPEASQGVTYDKRGNPTYRLDFMDKTPKGKPKPNLPFGVVNMPAIRRVGGMDRTQLWEALRSNGWFVDDTGEGNAGNANASAYTNDEASAAQMVYAAIQGEPIYHPTEGADARMERESIARQNSDIEAAERDWKARTYEQAEANELSRRLRDEYEVEIAEADQQEAASLADLTTQALDAGVDPATLVRADDENAGAYAARVWQAIKENPRGNDTQASERSDTGSDQVAQSQEAPVEAEIPSRPRTGLFADPSPRESAEALERQRDAERNGKTGGRVDTGDGGLFDGPRPEQMDVERPAAPAPAPVSPADYRGITVKFTADVDGRQQEVEGPANVIIRRQQLRIQNLESLARCLTIP